MRAGLACNEYFPDEEPKLSADAAISLFRIAQESFANIIKLSAAKTVDVTLDIDDDEVVFRIKDDGRGISDPSSESDVHVLASMRHRVRALGGTFEMSTTPAGGTLEVRIPVARDGAFLASRADRRCLMLVGGDALRIDRLRGDALRSDPGSAGGACGRSARASRNRPGSLCDRLDLSSRSSALR